MCLSLLFSVVFSLEVDSRRIEIMMYLVSFCPTKSTINSFSHVIFNIHDFRVSRHFVARKSII